MTASTDRMLRKETLMLGRQKPIPQAPPPLPPLRLKGPLYGTRLAPYSGQEARCSKCGASGINTVHYAPGSPCRHFYGRFLRSAWGAERLHRECFRCNFTWDEACLPLTGEENTQIIPVQNFTETLPVLRPDTDRGTKIMPTVEGGD